MTRTSIAKRYLKYLEHGDMERIVDLFSETGTVSSPLYGDQPANAFYASLQNDTNSSKLELKGIFDDHQSNKLALHFNYHWVLKTEATVNFDVVDIISFNKELKIDHLQIIYDTVVSRQLINNT
ncbi:nuclear transport factor 2 family protein [uncultured Psychroserpens sp.]|uniref:nuclear transport factor 2 family protein n=1 Tax=uncultured Psychroserpens sp. TaxID=255436 RepID=UPI002603573A|nr:nuclear transport factor 2 family protein [uncultured Psychroserpens sp.]